LPTFTAHAEFRNGKIDIVIVLPDYKSEYTLISEKLIQTAEAEADVRQSQGTILTGPNSKPLPKTSGMVMNKLHDIEGFKDIGASLIPTISQTNQICKKTIKELKTVGIVKADKQAK
jgi:hypothetical protein